MVTSTLNPDATGAALDAYAAKSAAMREALGHHWVMHGQDNHDGLCACVAEDPCPLGKIGEGSKCLMVDRIRALHRIPNTFPDPRDAALRAGVPMATIALVNALTPQQRAALLACWPDARPGALMLQPEQWRPA